MFVHDGIKCIGDNLQFFLFVGHNLHLPNFITLLSTVLSDKTRKNVDWNSHIFIKFVRYILYTPKKIYGTRFTSKKFCMLERKLQPVVREFLFIRFVTVFSNIKHVPTKTKNKKCKPWNNWLDLLTVWKKSVYLEKKKKQFCKNIKSLVWNTCVWSTFARETYIIRRWINLLGRNPLRIIIRKRHFHRRHSWIFTEYYFYCPAAPCWLDEYLCVVIACIRFYLLDVIAPPITV